MYMDTIATWTDSQLLTQGQTTVMPHKKQRRKCKVDGCAKIDAGGGKCVSHGGGRKCMFPSCTKGAQKGNYCRGHGGGSKCSYPEGCDKVDAGGGFCRKHGGGKRCSAADCNKADVGGGFCTAHGGGKKCSYQGCTTNSQGGGYCRAHGGGKRCAVPGCTRSSQGKPGFCLRHGKRQLCEAPKCRRVPVSDSPFCQAHTSSPAAPSPSNSTSPESSISHGTAGFMPGSLSGGAPNLRTQLCYTSEDTKFGSHVPVRVEGLNTLIAATSCCSQSSVPEALPQVLKTSHHTVASGGVPSKIHDLFALTTPPASCCQKPTPTKQSHSFLSEGQPPSFSHPVLPLASCCSLPSTGQTTAAAQSLSYDGSVASCCTTEKLSSNEHSDPWNLPATVSKSTAGCCGGRGGPMQQPTVFSQASHDTFVDEEQDVVVVGESSIDWKFLLKVVTEDCSSRGGKLANGCCTVFGGVCRCPETCSCKGKCD